MTKSKTLNKAKNVIGTALESCCTDPLTGFFRDGFCNTSAQDQGTHVICAIMTQEFLDFTAARGNDLSTPRPEWEFPGLKAGDKWCLCVLRWLQAHKAGMAPRIHLEACHENALDHTSLEILKKYQITQ